MNKKDFIQVVKTPSIFKVDETFQDERFMRVRLTVMHSGENLNKSSFSTKVIKDAKDTFANIPILANMIKYTDENGETHYDYGGHDAHIEEDAFNEGSYRFIYDEIPVGIIPETNNFEIVHDDETDKDYVLVDGYLFREYGNYCCDILAERGNKTDVSAEIYTDEISFDAKNQVIVVNKMRMSGVTLLGEDVNPAMKGANAQVFSLSEEDKQSLLIKVMKELTDALHKYATSNGENQKKGGENSEMNKFEELLEKYGKTIEEITFEYEGLSDEELESAFASAFEDSDPDEAAQSEEEVSEEGTEPEKEEESADNDEEEQQEDEAEENFATVTVNMSGNVREFNVSLQDKISALYELVNNTYADADGTWYDVTVYEEPEKYVVMIDWWSGKGFKQSYKVKSDVYSLVGDRVEVFSKWLTQDEINALDKMKADYSVMEEELTHYREEPQKMEILGSDDYSLIASNEDFIALCDQANHFNMSVDEVTAKADAILTAAAKQHKFSVTDDGKKSTVKPFAPPKKKAKRFGSLFDGII